MQVLLERTKVGFYDGHFPHCPLFPAMIKGFYISHNAVSLVEV